MRERLGPPLRHEREDVVADRAAGVAGEGGDDLDDVGLAAAGAVGLREGGGVEARVGLDEGVEAGGLA